MPVDPVAKNWRLEKGFITFRGVCLAELRLVPDWQFVTRNCEQAGGVVWRNRC